MKTKLIEFQSGDGTLLVEVEQPHDPGAINRDAREKAPVLRGPAPTRGVHQDPLQQKVEQSVVRFDAAIQIVRLLGDSVIEKLSHLSRQPDEVNVRVGLKFTAEAGAIIAKTSAEGNLELSLTWKKH